MVHAVHTVMTSISRSNSPTFGTRSRSISSSQFGSKLKGLFKFTHTTISSNKSSQFSPSTEHVPSLSTPPSEQTGNVSIASIGPYLQHQGLPHHLTNGTSTGPSSADGMDSLGGGNSSELEDTIRNN